MADGGCFKVLLIVWTQVLVVVNCFTLGYYFLLDIVPILVTYLISTIFLYTDVAIVLLVGIKMDDEGLVGSLPLFLVDFRCPSLPD